MAYKLEAVYCDGWDAGVINPLTPAAARAHDAAGNPYTVVLLMLPLFEPRSFALRQIQRTGATAFWSCFVTAKPTGNLLWLEPEVLSRLGEVGAALVFDIYDSDGD